MHITITSMLLVGAFACTLNGAPPEFGEDSKRKDGVPVGIVTHHTHTSQIFPGTIREYYVYVPKQYNAEQPASVMVFQDGHAYVNESRGYRATIVMDNLIHQGKMPVTIGIFINPGVFAEKLDERMGWKLPEGMRGNRSVEYDSLNDDYARMLEEEILPKVAKEYKLTDDPDQRAICGASSGGICAFTVAWERPDLFRKVVSHIGSYTNIRGGHVYPALIRKGEKKPVRIYLQDGSNDLDNEHGNWWLANQQMNAALKFRDYDLMWSPDEGDHGSKYAGPKLPEAMKWIWRTAEETEGE